MTWVSNQDKVTPGRLFKDLTNGPKDLFNEIHVTTWQSNGKPILMYSRNHSRSRHFIEQRHRSFGRCQTIKIPDIFKDAGVEVLKLNL